MMTFNQCVLKVVLNHKEQRTYDNKLFFIYTFTDFNSGNSFDCWVTSSIDFVDKMNLLTESKEITFNVVVKKEGKIKLLPLNINK